MGLDRGVRTGLVARFSAVEYAKTALPVLVELKPSTKLSYDQPPANHRRHRSGIVVFAAVWPRLLAKIQISFSRKQQAPAEDGY